MSSMFSRTTVKEVHYTVNIEDVCERQDVYDFDTIVITVRYFKFGRPSTKQIRIPAGWLESSY